MFACWYSHLYRWRLTIRMNEAWRIKQGILVSDKIVIFSLFVGCFYHKGPALNQIDNVTVQVRRGVGVALCKCGFPSGRGGADTIDKCVLNLYFISLRGTGSRRSSPEYSFRFYFSFNLRQDVTVLLQKMFDFNFWRGVRTIGPPFIYAWWLSASQHRKSSSRNSISNLPWKHKCTSNGRKENTHNFNLSPYVVRSRKADTAAVVGLRE